MVETQGVVHLYGLSPDGIGRLKGPAQGDKGNRAKPESGPASGLMPAPQPAERRLLHRHGQKDTEGDSHRGHDRMQQKRQQQEQGGLSLPVRQDARHRQQNEGRGHGARVQMLIHHVQPGSGYRQRKHGGHQGNAGPLRPRLGKELARNRPAPVDDQRDGGKLPEQLRGRHRDSGPAHESGDPVVEEAGL